MHSAPDLVMRWPSLDSSTKRARLQNTFHLSAGPLAEKLQAKMLAAERFAGGLWLRDPSVWSSDPQVQRTIADRLGWLHSSALMADSIERLLAFAEAAQRDGFAHVVLLGMGGSSLAPEVLRAVLGEAPGWPHLHVLDSSDPAAIAACTTPPESTLYLIASKSGTTIEPVSLAAHFERRLQDAHVARWADHFVAITDESTPLAARARADGFRELFINPSDIGGRYSALSFFGLVPAALMGQDISAIVGWAVAMLAASEPGFGTALTNPSVALGLAIAAAADAGYDKLTLIMPTALQPFGPWVEQLVAESTGKQGSGVVPVAGEELGEPKVYGADRFFIRLRFHKQSAEDKGNTDITGLETAGVPLADIELPEVLSLGAEFIRWEIATAVAGGLLGVDPFDEPNVQQAKYATQRLLDEYKARGHLLIPPPDCTLAGDITFNTTAAARRALVGRGPEAVLTLIRPGDYFAVLAYVGPDQELAEELSALRHAVRDRTRAATMFEYGPRYLHSTGQIHKGGPNTGVFLLVSATPRDDLSIPGEVFSFGTLEQAQAFGDFASLDATGRRAVHIHLPAPDRRLIRNVAQMCLEHLPGS
jgi:glucose-6-phosphate isomerase